MAGRLILGIANPALDANGEVDADATLTYYENLTTTPQTIYADEGLQTPLTNPLVCDAAGRFPMVWAPDGSVYTVKWTPSGAADITYDYISPLTDFSSQFQALGKVVVTLVIDGNGSTPATGVQEFQQFPYTGTITDWTIMAVGSGTAEVDVWIKPFVADSAPTISNSIVASAPITLTAAHSAQNSTLTGWTKDIAANSEIGWNLNSVSGSATKFVVQLTVQITS